jgi:hypothetical protein
MYLSANCSVESSIGAHFLIQTSTGLLLILFSFRDNGWRAVFKVYFDRDYRYHKYRLATSRMPFVLSSTPNSDGMHDVFFFNMGNTMHFSLYRWTLYLTIRDLLNTEYYDQFASAEFYAPSYVQMEVIHFDAKVC